MLKKWFTFPVMRVGAIAVLALLLLMAFPNTRALAVNLLKLFRVRQVVILPVNSTGYSDGDMFASQLNQMLSSTTVMTDEYAPPIPVLSAEEASEIAGFNVRLPEEPTPFLISVIDSAGYVMRVNKAEAQAILDAGGRSDLVLPDEIDGAEISISVPSSVRTQYGICPTASPMDMQISVLIEAYPDCVVFSQLPNPVVNVPKNVDVKLLAEIALQFVGMSPEEASSFTKRVNLETTLVLPIPVNTDVSYSEVLADEVIGKLIQSGSEPYIAYVLLWVKGDIVYVVRGWGADTFRALEIANTLP